MVLQMYIVQEIFVNSIVNLFPEVTYMLSVDYYPQSSP
jgi:hypothetical protein